uniref:DUF4939 domain-containing protein n=1 Tax=Oryzias latipes TaxID=8090 RepID=A0A3P9LF89_ORYLA
CEGEGEPQRVPAFLPHFRRPDRFRFPLHPGELPTTPKPFHGDVEACGGFLLQCQLLFQQAPRFYHSDHCKITLIVNSLRSKALQWAQAFLAANPITHLPFNRFIDEFRDVAWSFDRDAERNWDLR